MNRFSEIGRPNPRLMISYPIGRPSAASTPSTVSSMYVQSRSIFPWLKTGISVPSTIARITRSGIMSGRPAGPYTLKKRSAVMGRAKRWVYVCAMISALRLLAG
jgi:hypothetical protein